MNRELIRYRRAVKRQLRCTGKTRRTLLHRLQSMLDSFLDEHPAATPEDLKTAFGPPEAMASLLCENLTETDRRSYNRKHRLIRIIAGSLIVLMLLFSFYVFFLKQAPMIFVDSFSVDSIEEGTSQTAP